MKEIFIGEHLVLSNPIDASVSIASKELTIFKDPKCPENVSVDTTDFPEGIFSVVIFDKGALISNEVIKVKSPFIGKSKKTQLREMINDLDKVIQYRLTNNEEAIQQMSINGKSFVYETLDALMSTRKKLVANLDSIIKSELIAQGKSPILTIKARFQNP